MTARAGRPPGLAVVLVGARPDSKIYVHRKEEACRKARCSPCSAPCPDLPTPGPGWTVPGIGRCSSALSRCAEISSSIASSRVRMCSVSGSAACCSSCRPCSAERLSSLQKGGTLTVGAPLAQVGIRSVLRELPDSVTQAELEGVVRELCADDGIDGLLVQLPLPLHIDEEAIIDVRRLTFAVMSPNSPMSRRSGRRDAAALAWEPQHRALRLQLPYPGGVGTRKQCSGQYEACNLRQLLRRRMLSTARSRSMTCVAVLESVQALLPTEKATS